VLIDIFNRLLAVVSNGYEKAFSDILC